MFKACIDGEFCGQWHTNAITMDITPVQQIPTVIDLVITNLQQLRCTFTKPYLVIFFEH